MEYCDSKEQHQAYGRLVFSPSPLFAASSAVSALLRFPSLDFFVDSLIAASLDASSGIVALSGVAEEAAADDGFSSLFGW